MESTLELASSTPTILVVPTLATPTPTPSTPPTPERPSKRSKPSSTKFKAPKVSPFKIYSTEEDEQAKALDNTFVNIFKEKCILRPVVPGNFVNVFPVDIWKDILDYVHSPSDLLSLCCASSYFYLLTIPHLYGSLTIRSPFYYGEVDISPNCRIYDPHNLITIDNLLKPVSRGPDEDPSTLRKRKRLLQTFTNEGGHIFVDGYNVGTSSSTKFPPKCDLLHYVKDLKVKKWEGADAAMVMTQKNAKSASDCRGERQLVVQGKYRPEGVADLDWTKDGVVVSLSTKLAELLRDMKSLESFCFNPQRYISIPYGPQPGEPESDFRVNGVTAEIFAALKSLPHFKSLKIDYTLWDPLDQTTDGSAVLDSSGYNEEKSGFVGFKNLEELVIYGIYDDRRLAEIAKVIAACMFSKYLKRRLKWLEVRVDQLWYDDLQDEGDINATQDLWDWAVSLWGKLFGTAESLRCSRGYSGLDIGFLLEFGPIRWQWQCPKLTGLICRSEALTAINLRGVNEKQIIGAIKRLTKMGTASLKVFAVECRLTELNRFLKRFCGLKELYVFEPDAIERYEAKKKLQPGYKTIFESRVPYNKPIDIKGIQWTLDTICKFHLITLEVLVIEEIICPPHINCASTIINNIGGWRERGMKLRELGVHFWGPWEDIGEFLTAFEGLRCLHLFNCDMPQGALDIERSYFLKASLTAAMIAKLWGRDIICAKKKSKPIILEEDRWIGIGPQFLGVLQHLRWKWKLDDALKYVNDENVLEYASEVRERPWEKGGRMWKTLREGGVLKREDFRYI